MQDRPGGHRGRLLLLGDRRVPGDVLLTHHAATTESYLSESDTRAKLIDSAIYAHGWTEHLSRREETAGAIEIIGGKARKQSKGRVDQALRVRVNRDAQPVAVASWGVEVKMLYYPGGTK